MSKAKRTGTVDQSGQALYLQLVETREHGYYHLLARVVTQRYDDGSHAWVPYGCDDTYSDGLLWSGLRVSCQGDDRTRDRAEGLGEGGPVYGFSVEYRDVYSLDLRTVRRMAKTLERIDKGLAQLHDTRGYVRSYGEYLGRVAEVLGCGGFGYERSARSREMSGQQWDWCGIGDGVNRANGLVREWARPKDEGEQRRQLTAGEGAADVEVAS